MPQKKASNRYKRSRPISQKQTGVVEIERLSDECRGIAHHDGKIAFIDNALTHEIVEVEFTKQQSRFWEGKATAVLTSSDLRIEPMCSHYLQCGGCDLQHLEPQAALQIKQDLLLNKLLHHTQATPQVVATPIFSKTSGYRCKARIGINQRQRDGQLIVGYRRKQSSQLMNIDSCPVLPEEYAALFSVIREKLSNFNPLHHLTEVQLYLIDRSGALCFRVTKPPSESLKQALLSIGDFYQLQTWVQENQSTYCLSLNTSDLKMTLASCDLHFRPGDFIQSNHQVNEQMVQQALSWLHPCPTDYVFDLFCGLGNFAIPCAAHAKFVVGVEGNIDMVQRAQHNAKLNQIENTEFLCWNLQESILQTPWHTNISGQLVILDPSREGAFQLVQDLVSVKPRKILYIACNPQALIRDAGVLLRGGYHMFKLGVLDMFPMTSHFETMVLFERTHA